MSTKIYNGLKIDTANIKEIHDVLIKLSKEIELVAKDNYAKQLASMYVEAFDEKKNKDDIIDVYASDDMKDDNARKFLNCGKSEILFQLLYNIVEYNHKAIKKSEIRNPCYDFNLEMFIYPFSDTKTLLNPRFEQRGYNEAIQKHFDEYAYWNSTDRPEELSEKEWDERRDDWDVALDRETDVVKWEMYSSYPGPFNLFNQDDRRFLEDAVIKHLTTKEERAYKIIWYRECDKAMKEILPKDYKTDGFMKYYFEAKKKTDARKEELEKEAKEYAKELDDITIETLKTYEVFKNKEIKS